MNARALTVAALRELLELAPADAIVVVPGRENGWDHVNGGQLRTLELERFDGEPFYDGGYQEPSDDEAPRVVVLAIGAEREEFR